MLTLIDQLGFLKRSIIDKKRSMLTLIDQLGFLKRSMLSMLTLISINYWSINNWSTFISINNWSINNWSTFISINYWSINYWYKHWWYHCRHWYIDEIDTSIIDTLIHRTLMTLIDQCWVFINVSMSELFLFILCQHN